MCERVRSQEDSSGRPRSGLSRNRGVSKTIVAQDWVARTPGFPGVDLPRERPPAAAELSSPLAPKRSDQDLPFHSIAVSKKVLTLLR